MKQKIKKQLTNILIHKISKLKTQIKILETEIKNDNINSSNMLIILAVDIERAVIKYHAYTAYTAGAESRHGIDDSI